MNAPLSEDPINQCDGCRRGVPVENGIHRGGGFWQGDSMVCTAERYKIMSKRTEDKKGELRGQCNCAVGMLEAALTLVGRVSNDGPKGNPFGGEVAAINSRILSLQRQLLTLHDENSV